MLYETSAGEVVIETNEIGLCVSVNIVNEHGRTVVWRVEDDEDAAMALGSVEDFEDRIAGYLVERNIYRSRYKLLVDILTKKKSGRKFLAREARERGFCSQHLALDAHEVEDLAALDDEEREIILDSFVRHLVRRNKKASAPWMDVCV